ncbi:DUF3180 family protein [Sporichthya polymorpha]|uniref:DUF3180 family protein n=1 Tax=Sporichthya polymorpha TaxID=35751 RepID=UPI0003785B68|nr:DUF3180 family protein [Sporichthya polymorpha]
MLRPTRPPVLAAVAVLAGSVGYSAGLLIDGSGRTLPRVPPTAAGVLALLAAVLVGLAVSTRGRLRAIAERRPDARALNALQTARYVVLARASSPVGAAMAGGYGGYTLFLAGDWGEPGRSDLGTNALAAAVASVAVVAGALFLEHVCRVPGGNGDGPDRPGLPGPRADHAG